MPLRKIKVIEIKNKGRGVVATEKILKNEIIEYCPLIQLREKDSRFIKTKGTSDTLYYHYLQQPDLKRNSIMLGYGSLYNRSSDPNAEIDYDNDPQMMHIYFRAIKDIEPGEEITWDYKFDNGIVEFLSTEQKK
ncbi:MAG: SET domain-containing protein-lysine N-methyltransferase [Parcubacteria group bacterium]